MRIGAGGRGCDDDRQQRREAGGSTGEGDRNGYAGAHRFGWPCTSSDGKFVTWAKGKQDGDAGSRRHALATTSGELTGDGVGGLVAVLNQGAKRVDEVFDLSFLHAEEIELPRDLV
jgi:hypothetical protein